VILRHYRVAVFVGGAGLSSSSNWRSRSARKAGGLISAMRQVGIAVKAYTVASGETNIL
jgi:hypothetical protein